MFSPTRNIMLCWREGLKGFGPECAGGGRWLLSVLHLLGIFTISTKKGKAAPLFATSTSSAYPLTRCELSGYWPGLYTDITGCCGQELAGDRLANVSIRTFTFADTAGLGSVRERADKFTEKSENVESEMYVFICSPQRWWKVRCTFVVLKTFLHSGSVLQHSP